MRRNQPGFHRHLQCLRAVAGRHHQTTRAVFVVTVILAAVVVDVERSLAGRHVVGFRTGLRHNQISLHQMESMSVGSSRVVGGISPHVVGIACQVVDHAVEVARHALHRDVQCGGVGERGIRRSAPAEALLGNLGTTFGVNVTGAAGNARMGAHHLTRTYHRQLIVTCTIDATHRIVVCPVIWRIGKHVTAIVDVVGKGLATRGFTGAPEVSRGAQSIEAAVVNADRKDAEARQIFQCIRFACSVWTAANPCRTIH